MQQMQQQQVQQILVVYLCENRVDELCLLLLLFIRPADDILQRAMRLRPLHKLVPQQAS